MRPEVRPIALRIVDRDDQWITLPKRVQSKILRFRSEVRRPLGSTSVNVQTYKVGRPGLDPGTLGFNVDSSQSSIRIRLTWLQAPECSPAFTEVSTRLLLRLQNWLYELGDEEFGVIRIRDSDSFA